MRNKRKGQKRGIIFTGVGLLLLTAALFLTGYNIWDGRRAGRSAQEANAELQQMILNYMVSEEKTDDVIEQETVPAEKRKLSAMEIDGNLYIGVLEIPSLGISLPVMKEWDYEKLKIAPCRYSGSYYTDDLVIAGHNYPTHFSPIKWVEPGSEVLFTTTQGEVFRYTVDWVETMEPTEIERMVSGDGWDLTLFTCTTGGAARCAVRCIKE